MRKRTGLHPVKEQNMLKLIQHGHPHEPLPRGHHMGLWTLTRRVSEPTCEPIRCHVSNKYRGTSTPNGGTVVHPHLPGNTPSLDCAQTSRLRGFFAASSRLRGCFVAAARLRGFVAASSRLSGLQSNLDRLAGSLRQDPAGRWIPQIRAA